MDTGPLTGYVIGVTADRRAGEQAELLERRGADVIRGATTRAHRLATDDEIGRATRALLARPPDVMMILTAIGLRSWIEVAESLGLADDLLDVLSTTRLIVRGPRSRGAAVAAGLQVEDGDVRASTAELVDLAVADGVAGRCVAVQLDGGEAPPVLCRLGNAGAEVLEARIYRCTLPDRIEAAERLVRAIADRRVDAVTFTSRPAVDNTVSIAERLGRRDDLIEAFASAVLPVCIGPVCNEGAGACGIAAAVVPPRPGIGAMVHALTLNLAERSNRLSLAGHGVRFQGRMVTVDGGAPVGLSDRERDLLVALTSAAGAVVSKRDLLRAVWGDPDGDEHVVEVTVARLRRRLGDAGPGLETVIRRGYRASAD